MKHITNIAGGAHWDNDVKVIAETDKAVHLEVIGDRRFNRSVGSRAWFPKAAIEIVHECTTTTGPAAWAKVKPWFIAKMTIAQDRVTGRAE